LTFEAPKNPLGIQPVLAQGDGWLFFASDPSELDRALETKSAGGALSDSAEYQRLAQGLPSEVNGLSFYSPRLAREAAALVQQITQGLSGAEAMVMAIQPRLLLSKLVGHADTTPGRLGVRVNGPDGVLWIAQGEVSAADFLASMAIAPAAIMAAIAIPNFLEAQGRSKISRAKADMRSMATGVEAYNVDWGNYPNSTVDPNLSILPVQSDGKAVSSFQIRSPNGVPGGMTTPIAYLTRYPRDPFAPDPGQTFGYHAAPGTEKGKIGWIMFSRGPDGDFDMDWEAYDPHVPQPTAELLARFAYDPTNGTTSGGDIIRVKQ
jgi:Tfp pilus assembly protein PilE